MFPRRWLIAALALCALPGLALAHGPTRQKVTESVTINAPAAEVWEKIGDFHDMSWHPAVEKTEGSGGYEPDKDTRKLTLQGGGTIDEMLYKWDPEKMSYSYRITEVDVKVLPVTNYSSHLTVKAIDENTTKVEWRGAFYRGYPNNDPPEELNDEAAVKAVTGVYRMGLDHLKETMESGS